MIIAVMITARLFFTNMMAATDGMMRKENTGITPLVLTANTIASPMDI
jgi:hypothetical protein